MFHMGALEIKSDLCASLFKETQEGQWPFPILGASHREPWRSDQCFPSSSQHQSTDPSLPEHHARGPACSSPPLLVHVVGRDGRILTWDSETRAIRSPDDPGSVMGRPGHL